MSIKAYVCMLLILAGCSKATPERNSTGDADARAKAFVQLKAIEPKAVATVTEVSSFAQEVGVALPNQLASSIDRKADRSIAIQQANVDANRANYEATAFGIEAGLRAQNAIKETKIHALKRMLAVKKTSLPLVDKLQDWDRREKLAAAGRIEMPMADRLREAQSELSEADVVLKRLAAKEPTYSSQSASLSERGIAYKKRLSEDINAYNLLARRLGMRSVAPEPSRS